jgi:hypothetical protein
MSRRHTAGQNESIKVPNAAKFEHLITAVIHQVAIKKTLTAN